jgi:hypothetical protein
MSEKLIPPRVVGTPEPETNADDDPELAALLEFEPVPRQVNRPDSWTPERQRRFLELIVQTGSPQQAARAMKKQLSGIESVYRDDEAGEFRASWDGICELVRTREERRLRALSADPIAEPPHRRNGLSPLPLNYPGEEGQGLNEYGEWEDEGSLHRRAEDARDSISNKLRRCRRLFLHEISGEPAKRGGISFSLIEKSGADEILIGKFFLRSRACGTDPEPDRGSATYVEGRRPRPRCLGVSRFKAPPQPLPPHRRSAGMSANLGHRLAEKALYSRSHG